eukprot:SAG22_NODE_3300_length_1795_cov_2.247642_2_plen_138_part_00
MEKLEENCRSLKIKGACDAYANAMSEFFDDEDFAGHHHTTAALELKEWCAGGNEAACESFESVKMRVRLPTMRGRAHFGSTHPHPLPDCSAVPTTVLQGRARRLVAKVSSLVGLRNVGSGLILHLLGGAELTAPPAH